jgi:hypothetical protein
MEPTVANIKHSAEEFKRKTKFALIAIFLFSLLVSLCIFVLAVSGANNNAKNSNTTTTTTTSTQSSTTTTSEEPATSSVTTTSEQASTLPAGWSYQVETNCGVSLAVPPKVAPYYEKDASTGTENYWNLITNAHSNDSVLGSVTSSWLTYSAFFSNGQQIGGDVIKGIFVMCKDNLDYTNMTSFKNAYLEQHNSYVGPNSRYAGCTVHNQEMTKWGQNVAKIWITCSPSTEEESVIYITKINNRFYNIPFFFDIYQGEEITQLRATAQQILNSLKFN